jgi:hypothetical protein
MRKGKHHRKMPFVHKWIRWSTHLIYSKNKPVFTCALILTMPHGFTNTNEKPDSWYNLYEI